MYRHGDVIIVQVKSVPQGAFKRPSTILARGEATGHSHRFATSDGVEVFDHGDFGYVTVSSDTATLIHDEHAPISLPRGNYQFWQQREYSPKEIRRVVD
jgi:hypothetical protein